MQFAPFKSNGCMKDTVSLFDNKTQNNPICFAKLPRLFSGSSQQSEKAMDRFHRCALVPFSLMNLHLDFCAPNVSAQQRWIGSAAADLVTDQTLLL
jgi:hypothetical protein